MAHTDKHKAIERLRKALDEISELEPLSANSPQFEKWQRDTRIAIANTFGSNSGHVSDFKAVKFFPFVIGMYRLDPKKAYTEGLESAAALLESMIDEINEYWEDQSGAGSSDNRGNEQVNTKEVFVVHGRDGGAREKVARFLEKLGPKPVVLHEQPNQGRTIIEKFEDFAHVGFAVVLLTPDDIGTLKDDAGNSKPRARQNVIFEFGYFIGKLGRENVCALVQGDLEIPSDYDGVLYTPLEDSGGWDKRLVQELKSAGYEIDANLMFQT